MTNEERIEERLVHAFERGYYHKVIDRVNTLKSTNPRIDHYDAFEIACTESKNEWLQNKNINDKQE